MIWIVALVIVGLAAVAGYHAGLVRVVFSFLGILCGALLASTLSPLGRTLVRMAASHPFIIQASGPVVAFLLVLVAFKILGHVANQKVEFFFKYKKQDEERYRWEHLSEKCGLALGVVNGVLYFILLMVPVYVLGYLSVQVTSEKDGFALRAVTQLRQQMHDLRFDRFLAAHDPAPKEFYQVSDITGLIYHNQLLESRLAHYPPLLSLAQRPELAELGSDVEFQNLFQGGARVQDVMHYPKVQAIVTNADLMEEIERVIGPELEDLRGFLETGKSPKYDGEKILGFWVLDVDGTFSAEKKRRVGATVAVLTQLKREVMALNGVNFLALTDHRALIRLDRALAAAAQKGLFLAQGGWKRSGGAYEIKFTGQTPSQNETVLATIEGDRLIVPTRKITYVFSREN